MARIEQLSEAVAAPRAPADPWRITAIATELAGCGYTLSACAERLGVFPRLGVNFWPVLRKAWTPNADDAVDTLLELLMDGRAVAVDRLRRHVTAEFVDVLLATGLAEISGAEVRSQLCLFPIYGEYVVTDRAAKNTAINQVMWLWGESYLLGGLVNRKARRRGIDLGTGSGVHALLASGHCESVLGVDISPRAVEFGRFNAALNGVRNAEFVLGDLFEGVDGTFDLVVANPPYLPDRGARAGGNFWTGGPAGTEILGQIVRALPERLDEDGAAHIVALYPCGPGTAVKELLSGWMNVGEWDVLDYTWAVPGFQDMLSAEPVAGDKRGWRFGVVSLRRARSNGWWKFMGGNGLFFSEDGSCAVTADHDLQRG
jgi:HemK-related putative methylase